MNSHVYWALPFDTRAMINADAIIEAGLSEPVAIAVIAENRIQGNIRTGPDSLSGNVVTDAAAYKANRTDQRIIGFERAGRLAQNVEVNAADNGDLQPAHNNNVQSPK